MNFVPRTPTRNIAHELTDLREMRRSLGGEALLPVDIDLGILAEAYPREGSFLSQENINPKSNRLFQDNRDSKTPVGNSQTSGPNSFFRSDKEREFAKNLMKELVQIYILQGIHGKEAFKKALCETRARIYSHRGEKQPELPPPIPSPALDDWSPRSTHAAQPARTVTPRSTVRVKSTLKKRAHPEEPSKVPITTLTPSRVKDLVAAIQSTPKKDVQDEGLNPVRKTPGSSARIKALGECIEATIAAGTPGKRARVTEPMESEPLPEPIQTDDRPAESASDATDQQKSQPVLESVSPLERPKRKAAVSAAKELRVEGRSSAKKKASTAVGDVSESENVKKTSKKSATNSATASVGKKRVSAALEPIEEEQHARPSRRAKRLN